MKPEHSSVSGFHNVCLRIDIASIIKLQSLLFGEAAISFDSDVNASSIKPESHLKEADHFLSRMD